MSNSINIIEKNTNDLGSYFCLILKKYFDETIAVNGSTCGWEAPSDAICQNDFLQVCPGTKAFQYDSRRARFCNAFKSGKHSKQINSITLLQQICCKKRIKIYDV